jgi:hypothetical protein
VFTSQPPWGYLPEKHVYHHVMYENSRPDKPGEEICFRVGLTNDLWGLLEESWDKESRLRPSFDIIVRLWKAAMGTTASGTDRGTGMSVLFSRMFDADRESDSQGDAISIRS